MEVSELYDDHVNSPTITYRDLKLLRILRKIESKGHCLTEDDFEYGRVTITSIGLVRPYYFYGKNAYRDFVLTYNLDPYNAFTGEDLPVKNGFIKLIFYDGYVVVRKEFLLKYFAYFKFKFDCITDKQVNIFNIKDFSFNHFVVVLKYYYAQIIVITLDMIVELYRLADFFVVDYAFMKRITVYINCFYSKIARTIGFYRYHKYFEDEYLGGDNTGLQVTSEEEDQDIDRLYYLYQRKCRNEADINLIMDNVNDFDEDSDDEEDDEDNNEGNLDDESMEYSSSINEDGDDNEDIVEDIDEEMEYDTEYNIEINEESLIKNNDVEFEHF
uniref:BTB domain-containing protein n=1 Tax=Strongyloides venezuelensis TaxID=75913 RepID=A0A0K0F8G6_STRVS